MIAWIKMRTSLPTDPDVLRIAHETGLDRFSVVGRLHAAWSWADLHSVDGRAVSATKQFLDSHVECIGFCAALELVGWLSGDDWSLEFPGFDKHNGKTAKNRASNAKRKSSSRGAKDNSHGARVTINGQKRDQRREEKRREEERVCVDARTDDFVPSPEGEPKPEPPPLVVPDFVKSSETRELLQAFIDSKRAADIRCTQAKIDHECQELLRVFQGFESGAEAKEFVRWAVGRAIDWKSINARDASVEWHEKGMHDRFVNGARSPKKILNVPQPKGGA